MDKLAALSRNLKKQDDLKIIKVEQKEFEINDFGQPAAIADGEKIRFFDLN
nr:hypothetical protein [candidate division Zixibacteria bacterium]